MSFLNTIIFLIICSHSYLLSIGEKDCPSAKTCSECISTSGKCFWCEELRFDSKRCNTYEGLINLNCNPNKIIGLKNNYTVIEDNPLNETIQLRPQKYKISLRADSEVKISLSYKRAEDYPMDLYYLMDLSWTMRRHKDNLAKVGQKLASTMRNTTKNFRIGFGAFVDKPVMPYSRYNPKRVNEGGTWHEATFSFFNIMPLSENDKIFVKRVNESKLSYNADLPEGTLDALMQVLVCKQEIGWRDHSTKIVVIATDGPFHYAGDGKLAGIFMPNDGLCHLAQSNYTHWEVLDYPSMQQIADTVQKERFNIVFSVANYVKEYYQTLVDIIGTTASISELKEEDNSIVELIEEVYKNISSSVELSYEINSDIEIKLYSNCSKSEKSIKTNKCEFEKKPKITFDAIIKLKSCPDDKSKWNQAIKIGITNVNESIEIDVQMLCECDCDKPANTEANATHCSYNGTLACGICSSCNGKRTGLQCECDPEKPINASDPESHCKIGKSVNICSNHGMCSCGKCQCNEGYSGEYCEYDDKNCIQNGLNGPKCNNNGVCSRQKCDCIKGKYSGKFCECQISNHTCIAPNSTLVCSGKGDCRCGQCYCSSNARGQYCQTCPTCESERLKFCNEIINCVPQICREFKSNCPKNCTKLNYQIVDQLDEQSNSILESTHRCERSTPDNDCDIIFTYLRIDSEDGKQMRFKIKKVERICTVKAHPFVASVIIISGVILLGLALLLIWKLITELIDRREFSQFKKELNNANWEQSGNPLYKETNTTFFNPTFGVRDKGSKKD